MTIRIYTRKPEHTAIAAACQDGFAHHGQASTVHPAHDYKPCDLAVVWGVHARGILDGQKAHGGRVLILERGYVGDRFHWTSMGFDGLNGRAAFHTDDVPGDRWAAHHAHLMQPWRSGGAYALLLGQVPGDAALANVPYLAWLQTTARALEAAGYLVVFRPHPQARHVQISALQARRERSLADELEDAALAVTWNSNAGVEAVLAGVPTITCDPGAMAWPVTSHAIGAPLERPDRQRWAERLAYCQWSLEEIAAGAAWAHLRRGVEVVA